MCVHVCMHMYVCMYVCVFDRCVQVRPITFDDFSKSLQTVKPSVSSSDLDVYIKWNDTYGS